MQAIKDLLKSERGLFALVLVAAATTLCVLDKMTIDAWREMSLYIFGIYVGGKTISGTAALFANSNSSNEEPVAASAPAAVTESKTATPEAKPAEDLPAA